MSDFVKVKKGNLETSVTKKVLQHYINNGWVEVKEEPVTKDESYDHYTKAQLIEIAKNRGLVIDSRLRKDEIIGKLLAHEVKKPSTNEGFTDNLIKE
jgi:hypothetical protein